MLCLILIIATIKSLAGTAGIALIIIGVAAIIQNQNEKQNKEEDRLRNEHLNRLGEEKILKDSVQHQVNLIDNGEFGTKIKKQLEEWISKRGGEEYIDISELNNYITTEINEKIYKLTRAYTDELNTRVQELISENNILDQYEYKRLHDSIKNKHFND